VTLAEALVLLLAGGAIGAVGGLLGIGGGVIAVPVLLDVLAARGLAADAATPVAIGTAQAVILFSSLSAALAHHRAGSVDAALLRAWLPAVALGGLAGLALAPFLPAALTLGSFAAIALGLAISLLRGAPATTGTAVPHGVAAPAAIGLLSSALGVGAGTLSGPVLGLLGLGLGRAVGAGAVFNLAVALPAAIGFALMGQVDWIATAMLALPAMATAPGFAALATRLPVARLRLVFAICLLAIALRVGMRLVA
jgi:uncharacterized membrane protein YfcA